MSARQAYKERLGSPRIGFFVVKCVGTLLGFQDCPNGGWCGMVIIDFCRVAGEAGPADGL
jgi:hypothetical protein